MAISQSSRCKGAGIWADFANAREYIRGVQMAKMETEGLVAALQNYVTWFCREYGLDIQLDISKKFEEQDMGSIAALQLLRIVQEALANIRKHAKASHCSLKLMLDDTVIRVIITDDGEGFDIAVCSCGTGFGFTTTRERAEKAGGMLKIKSVLGQGGKKSHRNSSNCILAMGERYIR